MARQWALPGLHLSVRHESTQCSPIVLDMKTDPIYRPMRPPLFFMDGSVAQAGREPQLMCNDHLIKLRQPGRKASWVRVSAEAYRRASIGKTYTG